MKNIGITRKSLICLAMLLLCAFLMTACSNNSASYDTYASAYNRLWSNGGIDASISADMKMEGESRHFDGNFKVDATKNQIYYELESSGGKTVQFSDGSYLYTEQGDKKIKYKLGAGGDSSKPVQQPNPDGGEEKGAPEFNTSDFLNDFASMLEASKIKELGLFDPIAKAAVTKTTKDGDVYTLDISDTVVKIFLNKLAVSQSDSGDTVQVTQMKNFKYTAVITNGVVNAQTYSGDVTVKVPASLMGSGQEKEYQVNFNVTMNFNNPGKSVGFTLPSTDGYEEISGF